jgi:hypothetical protein
MEAWMWKTVVNLSLRGRIKAKILRPKHSIFT